MPNETRLLSLVLDRPELVRAVEGLAPAELTALVEHVGLEDSAEIIALTTTDQLIHLADTLLWGSSRAGEAESFSPQRFAVWLEMMLEVGERFAVERLCQLPDELVMLALQSQMFVLDAGSLERYMAGIPLERADLIDKALDSSPYFELGEYLLVARQADGWQNLIALLVALQEVDGDQLERWLARCCHASLEVIDDNGDLYDVLTSAEMIAADAEAERLDRREAQGYVAPADARAFLAAARAQSTELVLAEQGPDPLTRGYFRRFASATSRGTAESRTTGGADLAAGDSVPALKRLLEAHGVIGGGAVALPLLSSSADVVPDAVPGSSWEAPQSAMKRAMGELAQCDPPSHAQRLRELAYLANVLLAGATWRGRRYRPREAAQAAVDVCGRGLDDVVSRREPGADLASLVTELGAVRLFRIGWGRSGADEP